MRKRLGQAVFSILALQITMAAMVIVSQLPVVKDGHRTNKAKIVCQGASLGYEEEVDAITGKVTASLVDVVNEDPLDYMKNVPQDVVDMCDKLVKGMSKQEKMDLIKD